jgi:DNA-directed RNA polymerase subunit RPC12/RpoP
VRSNSFNFLVSGRSISGNIPARMDLLEMERERQRLAALYAGMSDAELQRLAEDVGSLTEVAIEVLAQEAGRRGLNVSLIEPKVTEEILEQREFTVIRQFRDISEALLAKGLLESAGVEPFLLDDNLVRLNWFLSNFVEGVKLAVRPEDADAAKELLEQPIPESFEVEGEGEYEQPRCPRCGSVQISHQSGIDKRFALPALYVVSFPIPIPRDVWKCASCGAQWREIPDQPGTDGTAG